MAGSPIVAQTKSRNVHRVKSLPLIFWAVLVVFAALCVTLAYKLNVWQDEAYSLHSTSYGVAYAFHEGLYFEAQAPLYFVALGAWRMLNMSAFYARLLSIGMSIVTLCVTWELARRYVKSISPAFTLAAVAFNPMTIWAAVEIRPYAAAIMFSALLLKLFLRGFVDSGSRPAQRRSFVIVAILAAYTQYYVASVVFASMFALIVQKNRRVLRDYLLAAACVGVALIPIAFVLPLQLSAYHALSVAYPLPSYAVITALMGYLYPHDWIGSWAHLPKQNVLYFGFAALPAVLAFGARGQLRPETRAFAAIVLTLSSFFTLVIVVAHVHVLIPRHTVVLLLPTLLASISLIGDLSLRRRPLVLASFACVYFTFCALSFWHDYRSGSKAGDWRRAAQFVAANAAPHDLIAVFNSEAELPFRYYFKNDVEIKSIPRPLSFDTFDEEEFALHDQTDVASVLDVPVRAGRRVWLVQSDACTGQGSRFFGCSFLRTYIGEHFTSVKMQSFLGSSVTELLPLGRKAELGK